jgi:signal transduction histidine kinase
LKFNKNFFKVNSLRNKIWLYLIIFSVVILSFLWLFQVIFLNGYYEFVKTKEISKIASKLASNYGSESFKDTLDEITYEQSVCIELIYNGSEIYSSNSMNRGCMGSQTNNITYLKYKQKIIESGESKQIYKLINSEFGNKTILYGMKLDDDYYAIINASLEPLNSTIKILAGQLIYVTIIVFVLSFLIAYFVSKYISKPIVNLTKTAKEMAKGNHDIEFKTTGEIKEIDSLADTLNTANKELEHTDLLRRELMANVSHDLKTPLTMIKAYAEMVRDLTFDNKEKRNSNLNTIIDETDRLNLLVNDMLELSKMQSNVIELNLEKFDLNETIETVVNRFSYLEELDKYKFEYKGIKKAYILADKKKIEQVIYNLISNATNYVGEDKKVIVKLQEFEDVYHVEVIDHGKGIDKEDLNLIWDKYYRVDKKHKRNTIGTGLGLSIVKNIFIMHNIDYGVFSKKGKGTTFYFNVKKED